MSQKKKEKNTDSFFSFISSPSTNVIQIVKHIRRRNVEFARHLISSVCTSLNVVEQHHRVDKVRGAISSSHFPVRSQNVKPNFGMSKIVLNLATTGVHCSMELNKFVLANFLGLLGALITPGARPYPRSA